MKIIDNPTSFLREYYSDKGEFIAHMSVELIDFFNSKETEEERIHLMESYRPYLDGYDMRPWGYYFENEETI